MSGIRLSIRDGDRELAHIRTQTIDDFYYFRDSLHAALEAGGDYGSRFPTFMKRWEPDEWKVEEIDALQEEVEQIAFELRALPPAPPDGNWARRLEGSGRQCASLFDVFIDAKGRPLVGGIIDLCVAAKAAGKPIVIDESDDAEGPAPPPSGRWGDAETDAFLDDTARTLAKVMAARARSDAAPPVPAAEGAPGTVECIGCGREVASAMRDGIAVAVDGAEHLIEYRPCEPCELVTVAILRRADGRRWTRGPMAVEQAEAHGELPPYCGRPGDAACGCESHRFFEFLYFKYGWGD